MTLYLDTSALVKWYIAETDSDAFDEFIRDRPGAAVSRLTALELRSALARRRRNREITAVVERAVLQLFDAHVRDGLLDMIAMRDAHFVEAATIMSELSRRLPLRTLDALHLAVARVDRIGEIATADELMIKASKALKFQTHVFH